MALMELTVRQFLKEVLKAMRVKLRKHECITAVFRGWSCSGSIEFKDSTRIEKVYAQIKSIEEARPLAKDDGDLKVMTAEITLQVDR